MTNLSITTAGRIIGGLFLSAFFLYGGGSYLLASTSDGATPLPENAASLGQLSAGAGLMLLNSAAVTTVGVLAFHVLRRRHPRTASTYLLTRVLEGTLLALLPAGILTLVLLNQGSATTSQDGESWLTGLARAAVENGESTYWVAMAILGVGSMAFCRTLLHSGLLPRLLAMGGIVGYAVFALGSVLQLSGYHVGLALSAPGGLFEVVAGSYLLIKGFRQTTPVRTDSADQSGSGAVLGLGKSSASA